MCMQTASRCECLLCTVNIAVWLHRTAVLQPQQLAEGLATTYNTVGSMKRACNLHAPEWTGLTCSKCALPIHIASFDSVLSVHGRAGSTAGLIAATQQAMTLSKGSDKNYKRVYCLPLSGTG